MSEKKVKVGHACISTLNFALFKPKRANLVYFTRNTLEAKAQCCLKQLIFFSKVHFLPTVKKGQKITFLKQTLIKRCKPVLML